MQRRTLLLLFLPAVFAFSAAHAQNITDRHIVLDPLADHGPDTSGFSWLAGTRVFAEFARYSDGSGTHHRWNAKTGGWFEFARWDSTWSIALMGTMEMVADPLSDIGFNPRAIFWEEGLLATHNLGGNTALQFGYMHRCKHDIDNLEPLLLEGRHEQTTLIYSSVSTRYLIRPRLLADGPLQLYWGAALRNDLFLHLFDQREPAAANGSGRDLNTLADAVTVLARLALRPRNARYELELNGSGMMSLFGTGTGFSGRWRGIEAEFAAPGLELGMRFFNPRGAAFKVFARGEWQRNGDIVPFHAPARLFMVGIQAADYASMW